MHPCNCAQHNLGTTYTPAFLECPLATGPRARRCIRRDGAVTGLHLTRARTAAGPANAARTAASGYFRVVDINLDRDSVCLADSRCFTDFPRRARRYPRGVSPNRNASARPATSHPCEPLALPRGPWRCCSKSSGRAGSLPATGSERRERSPRSARTGSSTAPEWSAPGSVTHRF